MSIAIDMQNAAGTWVRVTSGLQDNVQVVRVIMGEVKRLYQVEKLRAINERTGATVGLVGYSATSDCY